MSDNIRNQMKTLIIFAVLIVASSVALHSVEIKGTISTGAYMGTPFWSEENLTGDTRVDKSMNFFRMYNRLSLDGRLDNFSVHLSGARSDGFNVENQGLDYKRFQFYGFDSKYHLTETKIYRAYMQYKLSDGVIKAGRLASFNRWYFGSVDGGALSYKFSKNFSFSGFGGVDVKYGKLYDDNNRKAVAYGDLSYTDGKYGGVLKAMYSDEALKSGIDFFGALAGVRFSANIGYDFTNSRLFDGSIAIFGFAGNDLTWSGNITRFTPYSWSYNYSSFIDRIQAGLTYKLMPGMRLNFKQMVSRSEDYMNYLSDLSLYYKYFSLGVNYFDGNTNSRRLGLSAGANYSPSKCFRIAAGIASTDYLFSNDYEEIEQNSLATYLKFDWNIAGGLWLGANFNHYDNNRALEQKYRGGLSLQYQFCAGGI